MARLIPASGQRRPEFGDYFRAGQELVPPAIKPGVGQDGRNRCLLSAFSARTGRNQPSSKQFIFGPAVWLCGLIQPNPEYGIAYIDWSQQEFGIAAAHSGLQNAGLIEVHDQPGRNPRVALLDAGSLDECR